MSKMGISVLASYRGGYNFESLELSRSLVSQYFPPMTSRISGLGLTGIFSQIKSLHQQAWQERQAVLPVGGFFRFRKSGESHAFDANTIHTMQRACETGSYDAWKAYSDGVSKIWPCEFAGFTGFCSTI